MVTLSPAPAVVVPVMVVAPVLLLFTVMVEPCTALVKENTAPAFEFSVIVPCVGPPTTPLKVVVLLPKDVRLRAEVLRTVVASVPEPTLKAEVP